MQSWKVPQTKGGVCSLRWRHSLDFYMFCLELKNSVLHRDLSASVCNLVPESNLLADFYECYYRSFWQKLLKMHKLYNSYINCQTVKINFYIFFTDFFETHCEKSRM